MAESLVLDGLDLNGSPYLLFSIDQTPAPKRLEWAENADSDGAILIRDPRHENSQWDVVVEVRAASRDLAHTAVGAITDKLQEASKNVDGIPLVWTPDNSSDSITWYVRTGTLKVPFDIQSGYLANPPVLQLNLSLTCRPFGYGTEVTVPAAAGTGPYQTVDLANIPGDVDAEARVIVTDTATQSRDFAEVGLEQRFQAGLDNVLTQNELTATGFAGSSTTRSGSVSTNVFRGTLTTSPVVVCGTGNQSHIGSYRPKVRVWATGTGVRVRFTYRDGDGPLKSLNWETPPAEDAWVEIDLGVITISPAVLGTQQWVGQIEAYTDTVGDTLDVDYLALVPVERYCRARRPLVSETPGTFTARSEFATESGAITGDSAAVGGAWVGAGDADDFSVSAGVATRTAVSDAPATGRWVTLDTNMTAQAVQVDFKASTVTQAARLGLVARYAGTTDHVRAYLRASSGADIVVVKRVGGTDTDIGFQELATPGVGGKSGQINLLADTWYTMRLMVDASGRFVVWFGEQGNVIAISAGHDSALATGGSLATGDVGIYDEQNAAGAVTRTYDNFFAFVPATDAVCFSGQSIEFRSDDVYREDSTGTYWGQPQERRGAPMYLPPAGDEGRPTRLLVSMRRNDPYTMANANVTDTQTVEVRYTPRYLYLPR